MRTRGPNGAISSRRVAVLMSRIDASRWRCQCGEVMVSADEKNAHIATHERPVIVVDAR